MKKTISLTLLLLAACLLPARGFSAESGALPRGIIVMDGRPAPDLRLRDMDDNKFDLADQRGQWVLVHFWASWCGPCRREMPTLQEMDSIITAEKLPFTVVLINTAENEDTIFSFLGIVAPSLNTLMDRDGTVTNLWQPRGLPASFFVDPAGNIQYVALGGRSWNSEPYLAFLRHLAAGKVAN
jgi:thiol-disulfide isomerase/thioredoxin